MCAYLMVASPVSAILVGNKATGKQLGKFTIVARKKKSHKSKLIYDGW